MVESTTLVPERHASASLAIAFAVLAFDLTIGIVFLSVAALIAVAGLRRRIIRRRRCEHRRAELLAVVGRTLGRVS